MLKSHHDGNTTTEINFFETGMIAWTASLHFIIIAPQNLSHLKMFPAQKQILPIWIYIH